MRPPRSTLYKRDALGRGGRQFLLPWGPGKTISTVEAAARLDVSDETIRKMCEEGEIQGWRLRGKKKSPWRVSAESLEQYIDKRIALYDTSGPPAQARPGQPTQPSGPSRPRR